MCFYNSDKDFFGHMLENSIAIFCCSALNIMHKQLNHCSIFLLNVSLWICKSKSSKVLILTTFVMSSAKLLPCFPIYSTVHTTSS